MKAALPILSAEMRFVETKFRDDKGDVFKTSLERPLVKFDIAFEGNYDFEAVNINGKWFVSEKLLPPFMREQFERQWEAKPETKPT